MKWEFEDIVEYLQDDYVRHYNNKQAYEKNDNEVDANYESAILDYIFDTLRVITGGTPEDVADALQDKIDGVFEFDPEGNPRLWNVKVGCKYNLEQDLLYGDYDSFVCTVGEETAKEMIDEHLILDNHYDVIIPKGTHMIYRGCDEDGWPTFEIHGCDLDFAGEAFKLSPR